MIIQAHTNPNVFLELLPYLAKDKQAKLAIGYELHEKLKNAPEDMLCATIKEDNVLRAILVACIEDIGVRLWLWRVGLTGKEGEFYKYCLAGFNFLEEWTRYKNHSIIRADGVGEKVAYCLCNCCGYLPDTDGLIKFLSGSIYDNLFHLS